MELNLKIIGALLIGLAAMHAFFPKQFGWKKELATLGLLSRQMMYVHTLFIALAILLMGIFCVTSANEIVNTPLGKGCAWVCDLLDDEVVCSILRLFF